jgi:hypothetical protein
VSVGLVASLGGAPPTVPSLRCVRADMVAAVHVSPRSPVWLHPPYKRRTGLYGWLADERTHTFVVRAADAPDARVAACRIKLSEEEAGSEPPSVHGGRGAAAAAAAPSGGAGGAAAAASERLNIQVSLSRANLLLRNTLRAPVLELDCTDIKAGVLVEAPGVTRCFAFQQSSLWSYNGLRRAWEPVIEPLQMLAHLDLNATPRARGGVQPGSWFKLTSTQGCVHVTLAHAALAAAAEAAAEWRSAGRVAGLAGLRRQLAGGEARLAPCVVTNTLEVAAHLQLDFGDHRCAEHSRRSASAAARCTERRSSPPACPHGRRCSHRRLLFSAARTPLSLCPHNNPQNPTKTHTKNRRESVMLPPGAQVHVVQPLPQPPSSHAPQKAASPPAVRLLADVIDARLPAGEAAAGDGAELLCELFARSKGVDVSWGMVTRCVSYHSSTSLNPHRSAAAAPSACRSAAGADPRRPPLTPPKNKPAGPCGRRAAGRRGGSASC